ncbi:MAG: 50S ribosomal protein L30 [Candidatus Methanoperedenaceae archaeon]|nr:50S ribosomal protein L30 [Candidatus Methanoperedenaceae archaeon]
MYAVVRIRGEVNSRQDVRDTMSMLHLHRVNHCVVIPETPNYRGMIKKVKDYVAFGILSPEALAQMLETRGRLEGGKRLTEEYLSQNTDFRSFDELAKALCEGAVSISDIPGLKPVFRLHPPRKGHKGIKRTYQQGGELGNHESGINSLLNKMR